MKRTSILPSKVPKVHKGIMEANVFRHGRERCMKTLKYQLHLILVEIYAILPIIIRRIQSAHIGIDPRVILQLLGQNHHVTTRILEGS